MWPFKKKIANDSTSLKLESNLGKFSNPQSRQSPVSQILPEKGLFSWNGGLGAGHPFKIRFYRFLRDAVPVLNSAIWTWTRLCASPWQVKLNGSENRAVLQRAEEVVSALDDRLYQPVVRASSGGLDALLVQFFNTLFTDGMVCGEIVLSPVGDKVDRFYFVDSATLHFELKNNQWEIYQIQDKGKVKLNPDSLFYYGLDTDVNNPVGKSLLSAVPFAARIEQELVSDMHKTMHNAGYHRLHVQIKPPSRATLEGDDAYVERANHYFSETVNLMKNFSPEDNPITWNDVEIKYIGPESRQAASSSWYLNHKAMLEDLASGLHLDPFMLGYSYGATQTWAGFKLDLVQKNVVSLQNVAKKFLNWVRNIELALSGLPVISQHEFDNSLTSQRLDKAQAEKVALENIVRKQKEGFISFEQAKELANTL